MISVSGTGTQVTTGASAVTVIPNDGNGTKASYLRIQALANCYVRPGFSGTTCLVGDILCTPNEAVILNVKGFTHIASLQETASAKYTMTPLDGVPN